MSKADEPRRGRFARFERWKVGGIALAVVLVVALVFTAYPFQSYLDQRHRTAQAIQRVNALQAENRELAKTVDRLSTPAEIERLARAEFGMVKPGETAYAILPDAGPPIKLPDIWPATP